MGRLDGMGVTADPPEPNYDVVVDSLILYTSLTPEAQAVWSARNKRKRCEKNYCSGCWDCWGDYCPDFDEIDYVLEVIDLKDGDSGGW